MSLEFGFGPTTVLVIKNTPASMVDVVYLRLSASHSIQPKDQRVAHYQAE
jgi:hypothetical protein